MPEGKILGGYILKARKTKYSAIRRMPPLYERVWDVLNEEVNRFDNKFNGEIIKASQKRTSIRQLAELVSWVERGLERVPNPRTIKKILSWLEGEGMITRQSNSQYTTITICNYLHYQNPENYKVTANTQQSAEQSKQPIHTNNKDKESKELKELKENTFCVFCSLYPSKRIASKKKAREKWLKIESNNTFYAKIFESILNHMTHEWSYNKSLGEDELRFVPLALTFINQERWDREIEHSWKVVEFCWLTCDKEKFDCYDCRKMFVGIGI